MEQAGFRLGRSVRIAVTGAVILNTLLFLIGTILFRLLNGQSIGTRETTLFLAFYLPLIVLSPLLWWRKQWPVRRSFVVSVLLVLLVLHVFLYCFAAFLTFEPVFILLVILNLTAIILLGRSAGNKG